jgi:Uma2 family endonuclease
MRTSATVLAPGRATIADLERVAEKAELIDGRIVRFMPTGYLPNLIAGRIFRKLSEHCDDLGTGTAYTDGIGFTVPPLMSGRESFSPDVSFATNAPPANLMKFVDGPPTFAVEVRSENDYSPAAESEMAEKRADYFEAGTLVVWDVDPIAETIVSYRKDNPDHPATFSRNQIADAEPAVPGWRLDTAWLFKQP